VLAPRLIRPVLRFQKRIFWGVRLVFEWLLGHERKTCCFAPGGVGATMGGRRHGAVQPPPTPPHDTAGERPCGQSHRLRRAAAAARSRYPCRCSAYSRSFLTVAAAEEWRGGGCCSRCAPAGPVSFAMSGTTWCRCVFPCSAVSRLLESAPDCAKTNAWGPACSAAILSVHAASPSRHESPHIPSFWVKRRPSRAQNQIFRQTDCAHMCECPAG
jgi:hypothetical protein